MEDAQPMAVVHPFPRDAEGYIQFQAITNRRHQLGDYEMVGYATAPIHVEIRTCAVPGNRTAYATFLGDGPSRQRTPYYEVAFGEASLKDFRRHITQIYDRLCEEFARDGRPSKSERVVAEVSFGSRKKKPMSADEIADKMASLQAQINELMRGAK